MLFIQYLEDARFSSVISDERYDNTVIKLDKQGFHPHFVYVQKVGAVCFLQGSLVSSMMCTGNYDTA